MKTSTKNRILATLGLALVAAALLGIYLAVSRLWEVLSAANPSLAAAVIAAAATIIVSTLSLIISRYLEARSKLNEEHRSHKVPVYQELIAFLSQSVSSPAAAAANTNSGGGFWRGVGDFLGKIWSLPSTIIGAAYGFAGMALGAAASLGWGALHVATLGRYGGFSWFGGSVSWGNNALQFHNHPIKTLLTKAFLPAGYVSEFTSGNAIVYSRGATPGLVLASGTTLGAHSQAHTLQGQAMGPFYLPAHLAVRGLGLFGVKNFLETGPNANPSRPW